jgi:DNA mismatch repair protein MutS
MTFVEAFLSKGVTESKMQNAFQRILPFPEDVSQPASQTPAFFSDLNLDQLIEAITASRQEYNLKPFFWTPLRDAELVRYRQEVMQDLEHEATMRCVKAFAERMSTVRRYLGLIEKLDFDDHKKGWYLEAALVYGEAVTTLACDLAQLPLASRGLLAFRAWVQEYAASQAFQAFFAEAQQVKRALSELEYCVIIEIGKFRVKRYEGETDYSIEIEKTFERFQQGDVDSYLVKFPESSGMSHIEAQILQAVAQLYPEPFQTLTQFCTRYPSFLDATLLAFDREIQFYLAYLDFIAPFRQEGLPFCYPQVSTVEKTEWVRDGFDLVLAHRVQAPRRVVLNDFSLQPGERILVVTGPNQGGKTTFARMFAQLHYLASLGCPIPGREAHLFLPDQIFTHFQRVETVRSLRSKLEDDLVRIHEMLAQATPNSLFVLNEIFFSTTLQDALFLSKEIMRRLLDLDVIGVWVTFLDELASFGEKTVSMVAMVDPHDPAIRTFQIVRKAADGLAYARSLAYKHRLTYAQIRERIHA